VREPARERKFRAPAAWLVGIVGILGCIYLFISLPMRTQIFFVAAQAIGLVLYAIYSLAQPVFKPIKIGTVADIVIGTFNGLLGGLTGLGGVISTISCQLRGWSKDMQRAVFQPVLLAAFIIISISLSVSGAVTSESLKLYGLGLPFMIAGIWSGFKLYGKIDDETFRKVVLTLLLFAGASLIVSASIFRSVSAA